jgi:hypothetical protein
VCVYARARVCVSVCVCLCVHQYAYDKPPYALLGQPCGRAAAEGTRTLLLAMSTTIVPVDFSGNEPFEYLAQ